MNILLVDNELKLVEHILKKTEWDIVALITLKRECIYKNEKRIKDIYEEKDFWQNEDLSFFNYKDLDFFWKAQLKIENATNREINDFQIAKWTYYRGYALVKKIFDTRHIDAVIVKGPNHGYAYDRMITCYATYMNIPNYNIEEQLKNKRVIYNNLDEELLRVKSSEDVEIANSLYYPIKYNFKRIYSNGWDILYALAYKTTGKLGEEIVKCIRYKNLGNDKSGVTIIEKIKKYNQIKKIKKFYCKVSKNICYEKKYVFYALHLEPEAVIAGYAEMDSQLVAIKMLSQCLPKGWILYVKEHPSQFIVNNNFAYYDYLYGASVFKTKRFYQEILKMKNVKLLNYNINSEKIVEHSQCVATFCGTVAAEAISMHIPVICFAADQTFYRYIDDVFKIRSFEDCKNAIYQIKKGFRPLYENFSKVCNEYFLNMENEYVGYENSVIAIKSDVEEYYAKFE